MTDGRTGDEGPEDLDSRVRMPRGEGPEDSDSRVRMPRDEGPEDSDSRVRMPRDEGPEDSDSRVRMPRDEGPEDSDSRVRMPRDEGGNEPPWWHSVPAQPPVDSVAVEGLKLLGALRDWAVDSGAVAAASSLAQNAAATASSYLAQTTEAHAEEQQTGETEPPQPVVRCSDCPVCQGLDALERTNPELAHTARAALTQVNTLLSGWLGAGPEQR